MERLVSFFRSIDDFIQRRFDGGAALLRRWPGIRLSTLAYVVQAIEIICVAGAGYAVWHLPGERWMIWTLIFVVGLSLWNQHHTHKKLVEREEEGSTEPIYDHRFVFSKILLSGFLAYKLLQEAGLWAKSELASMMPSEQHWSSMGDLWLIAFIVTGLVESYLLRCPPTPRSVRRPD